MTNLKVIEKLPTPILMPKNGNSLESCKWGYLIIFSDLSTKLDLSRPSELEINDAIENFFINM